MGVWDLQTIQAMRAAGLWPGSDRPVLLVGQCLSMMGTPLTGSQIVQTLTVTRDVLCQIVVVADGGDGTSEVRGVAEGLVSFIKNCDQVKMWTAIRADIADPNMCT